MDIDEQKVEEAVLALLYLNKSGARAWKGYDWGIMDALHEKGYISNPATKAKSVVLTEAGEKRSKELFEKLFAVK